MRTGRWSQPCGHCKAGMDIAYDGTWGYHPLVLTLANTGEVLSIVNRSGNRPSHEGAAEEVRPLHGGLSRGRFPSRPVTRRHRLLADRTPRPLGRRQAGPFHLRVRRDAQPQGDRRGFARGGVAELQRPTVPEPKSGQRRQRPDDVKDAIVRERDFETFDCDRKTFPSFAIGRPDVARTTA